MTSSLPSPSSERRLFLLRHAKSSWDDLGLADHDRPLAPRGDKAARRVARHLEMEEIEPALVLCSSARRTRQTLDAIRPALPRDTEIHIETALYGAESSELLDRLRKVDADPSAVMIIAHNPGLEDLALYLTGAERGQPAALAHLQTKFPTAALATLRVDHDWEALGEASAYLESLFLPRSSL